MNKLTKKQEAVYNALKELIQKQKQIPTLMSLKVYLASQFHVSSLNSVVQYLESLERKGYIFREKNKRGGISLREIEADVLADDSLKTITGFGFFDIPILGLADCGEATTYADQNYEGMVKVSKKLLPTKDTTGLFMVRVNGESMNKRGLFEGDYAIIRHKDYCGPINNGDIVLAVVNGLATIKTFFKTVDAVILRPESTKRKFQPIFLHPDDSFFINGKLVGIFKNK